MSNSGFNEGFLKPVGYELRVGNSKIPAPLDHSHNILPEEWKAIEYENGWVSFGVGWNLGLYMLDPVGIVHIEIAMKDGTTTDGTVITTLSEGYRPRWRVPWIGFDDVGGIITGEVNDSGEVIGRTGLNSTCTIFHVSYETNRETYAQSKF